MVAFGPTVFSIRSTSQLADGPFFLCHAREQKFPAFLQFHGACRRLGLRRVERTFISGTKHLMPSIRTVLCISAASLMALSGRAQITVVKPIPARATVTVNASKSAGAPIPRTIFGSFLEPLGNSTYNGLWAELLVNPSLEENLRTMSKNLQTLVHERPELVESSALGLPLPWEPLNAKQGNRYEPRWGHAANP